MTENLAVDFGTSRTKAAYLDPHTRQAQLMRLGHDLPAAPSLFYLERDSERVLWGYEAEEMLEDDPAGVVDVLKRHLQDRYIYRNRRKVAPRELLVQLLSSLRAQAGDEVAAFAGTPPRTVSLTVPVLYGVAAENLLREAATAAGFEAVELIPEPVAAARAWLAETRAAGQDVVVLDCGGGTLDWAYLRYRNGAFAVVPECPPDGDEHVGGYDVDLELLQHVKERLPECEEEITARQPYYLRRIRVLKERYCQGLPLRPISVAGRQVALGEADVQAILDERFIAQACENLSAFLQKVKSVSDGGIPAVLLVGGSGRIRGLKEAVEHRCACKAIWWERSEYATVVGALADTVPVPVSRPTSTGVPAEPFRSLAEHQDFIRSVAFSADGRTVVSASDDGMVKLLDVATGTERGGYVLDGSSQLSQLTLSFDAAMIVACNDDGSITLRDTATRRIIRHIAAHTAYVFSASFSRDGAFVVSYGADKGTRREELKLWSTTHDGPPCTFDMPKDGFAISADGSILASAIRDDDNSYKILMREVSTGHVLSSLGHGVLGSLGQDDGTRLIAFAPDAQELASSGEGVTRLWHLAGGCLAFEWRSGYIDQLLFSPDGKWLAGGALSANTVRLRETSNSKNSGTVGGGYAAFSPDSRQIATASRNDEVKVVEAATGITVLSLPGHDARVTAVAPIPGSQVVATASADATIKLWDLRRHCELRTVVGDEDGQPDIACSPDGRLLAACWWPSRIVRIMDLDTGEKIRAVEQDGRNDGLAFSADGRLLLSSDFDYYSTTAWNVATGQKVYSVQGKYVVVSPDGSLFATAGGETRLWDINTGEDRGSFETSPFSSMTFLPDGRSLAVPHDDQVSIYDIKTGQCRICLRNASSVNFVSVSPDGRLLAASSRFAAGTYLWDIANGRLLRTLPRLQNAVFSLDGRSLIGSSPVHTVRLWPNPCSSS